MESSKNLERIRHSLAHLLAAAVLELYPDAKPTIGPAIDNGFYYDIEFDSPVSDKDLAKIENKMKALLPTWKEFTHKEVSHEEAKEFFKSNPFKLELLEEIVSKGEKITLYTCGTFTDLCRGGHVAKPAKEIDPESFKLSHIAGAYWRGDEKNKMLTRIYGLAFESKEALSNFEVQMEEGKKRDHRKLGKELDLFTFSDLVGAGLPMFTPKGTAIRNALQSKLLSISEKYGMQLVTIPHIAKRALYETSGHAQKFGDELLKVISHYDEFVMKPVNCPHHTQIYASKPRSYRDLPVRYMESTMQYRDEQPGEISGLTRVRAITVDDGHIFCRVDQIKNEAKNIAKIIEEFYSAIGLFGKHWVSLSVRDPNHPEKYIGGEEGWQSAEKMLEEISDDLGLKAERREGEAALYGPKLDYMFKDSLGREWQLATIQIDFAMPERFGLEYTDKDGKMKTPVMIHRAILGSYERFMAILIEHFAGNFPLWISPVQVKVLPVKESHNEYAKTVYEKLTQAGFRAELDQGDEGLGKKVRAAKIEKIPYWLVIGDKEIESGKVTLESRDKGSLGQISIDDLILKLEEKEI